MRHEQDSCSDLTETNEHDQDGTEVATCMLTPHQLWSTNDLRLLMLTELVSSTTPNVSLSLIAT